MGAIPSSEVPAGQQLVAHALESLARLPGLSANFRIGARVTAVSRRGHHLVHSNERDGEPFVVRHVRDVSHRDLVGAERYRYPGCMIRVPGSGRSTAEVLTELAEPVESEPRTAVTSLVRGEDLQRFVRGNEPHQVLDRQNHGPAVAGLVSLGAVHLEAGFRIGSVTVGAGGVTVYDGARRNGLYVPPHAAEVLAHTEARFYLVGMKSFGRAPTFLLQTGYGQLRSVVAAIAGAPSVDAAEDGAQSLAGAVR